MFARSKVVDKSDDMGLLRRGCDLFAYFLWLVVGPKRGATPLMYKFKRDPPL